MKILWIRAEVSFLYCFLSTSLPKGLREEQRHGGIKEGWKESRLYR